MAPVCLSGSTVHEALYCLAVRTSKLKQRTRVAFKIVNFNGKHNIIYYQLNQAWWGHSKEFRGRIKSTIENESNSDKLNNGKIIKLNKN